MSIKKQMILYFSCLMIVIFVLMEFINGCQAYGLLKENITASITEALNLGVKNMDYYFQDAGNVCSSIMADQRTQDILNQEIGEDLDGRILARELNKVINQYASTRPYIIKVYLLDRYGKIITPEVQGEDIKTVVDTEKSGGTLDISPLHQAGYLVGGAKVFSLVKPVFAYNNRTDQIGTIVADVDYRVLEDAVGDYALPMNGTVVLFDGKKKALLQKENGKISWESFFETEENDHITVNGKRYVNIREQSQITGWTLSALIPRKEFIKSIFSQMWLTFLLLGICLAVIVVVSRKIIRSIHEPLNLLGESMKKIEEGNFDIQIPYGRQDEFSTLINGYNMMVVKIKMLLNEVVEQEKIRRNAELYALQAQINPHFLYNTLNSIRYFARVYQAEEIKEMTTALIQLSKASLSSEKFISIRRELELTEHYLDIQKMRYGDIFQVNSQVEEDVKECLIPRFSIQPVVENALFHGILPKGSGLIKICIEKKNEGIYIEICDDGIGISEENLEHLNERLSEAAFTEGKTEDISRLKNIGLENISYRIRINYEGGNGGIQLYNGNPGVRAVLWIPGRIFSIPEDEMLAER